MFANVSEGHAAAILREEIIQHFPHPHKRMELTSTLNHHESIRSVTFVTVDLSIIYRND
jgi:hypothetical protein